jgi:ATP-binding cassette subfamily B protein
MGMITTAIKSLRALESFDKSKVKEMRYCAILTLVSTSILYTIPFVCGFLLDWMVEGIETGEGIEVDILLDICTVIVLGVVLWYVASSESKNRMARMSLELTRRIREDLNRKMMRISVAQIDRMPAGDLSSRFTNDVPAVSKLISSDYTGFIAHLTMIVSILVMMLVSTPLLGIFYIILIPVVLLIGRRITKRSEKDYAEMSLKMAELNSQMSDIITTHKTIKTENLESKVMEDFNATNEEFTSAYVSKHIRSGMLSPMVNIMVNAGYLITVLIGVLLLYYHDMPVGMFMTFMIYVRVLSTPLLLTVTVFDNIRVESIALNRVIELLNLPEEEVDVPDDDFTIKDGIIKVQDVSFSYEDGHEILHNVTAEFRPGEVTVLTGPTGSGKTTLANILMGFYRPDSGTITIDGKEVPQIPRSELGRNLTAVLQNPWMFSGTIRENIIYNRPELTDADVLATSQLTGLHEYVSMLPDGYDTYIGEDISEMPLAQRRMLGMARALIGDPKILVLDEAVAGLDPITGQLILDRLKSHKEGRTVIIISHNQALIDQADAVVYLEDGKVGSYVGC